VQTRERILLERQALLQMRSGLLRDELLLQAHAVAPALVWADHGLSAWRWLRSHPQWPLGALMGLVVLRPRRMLGWAGRGLWLWQLWRRFGPVLRSRVRRL
jgi:hypothetical protein